RRAAEGGGLPVARGAVLVSGRGAKAFAWGLRRGVRGRADADRPRGLPPGRPRGVRRGLGVGRSAPGRVPAGGARVLRPRRGRLPAVAVGGTDARVLPPLSGAGQGRRPADWVLGEDPLAAASVRPRPVPGVRATATGGLDRPAQTEATGRGGRYGSGL